MMKNHPNVLFIESEKILMDHSFYENFHKMNGDL